MKYLLFLIFFLSLELFSGAKRSDYLLGANISLVTSNHSNDLYGSERATSTNIFPKFELEFSYVKKKSWYNNWTLGGFFLPEIVSKDKEITQNASAFFATWGYKIFTSDLMSSPFVFDINAGLIFYNIDVKENGIVSNEYREIDIAFLFNGKVGYAIPIEEGFLLVPYLGFNIQEFLEDNNNPLPAFNLQFGVSFYFKIK